MSILTPLQTHFLDKFFQSYLGKKFFLSGETALAQFYLHHRISQDLDLFTLDQELSFDFVNAEILKIADKMHLTIKHQATSPTFLQYIFQTTKDETLKVDLVKDVPLHFGEIQKFDNYQVDSLENIAVGKLLSVFGRADGKDFIDLYFLLVKDKQSLSSNKRIKFGKLFKLAKQKDQGLHELYLAEMLAMVENISQFPKTLKPFNKNEMKHYFLKLAEKLLKRIRP